VTVTIGRDGDATPGVSLAVTQVVARGDRDVALARLAGPVPNAKPVKLAGTPAKGTPLKLAGYGRSATVWVTNQVTASSGGSDLRRSADWVHRDRRDVIGAVGGRGRPPGR
jgi:hypothetical protein